MWYEIIDGNPFTCGIPPGIDFPTMSRLGGAHGQRWANEKRYSVMLTFLQWLFLVPLIGGRCYIMTYLAVRTTYIALIYCQLGDYMLPTTYYGNQETPLISHTEQAVRIIRNCQLWIEPWPLKEDVAGLAAWNCSSTVWWIIHTHRIHVWYICLHLVDFYGKCREI